MANTFKRKVSQSLGTTALTDGSTAVGSYTVPAATTATIIGLLCSNRTTTDITVDIGHYTGSVLTYLVKDAPVQTGSTMIAVGGTQKLVLEPGDSIRVRSNIASSVDVIMSILEIT
jgi:hypothetical protein